MNRGIALFVALVLLLAHTLAIHADDSGAFAFPCDQAYVPLRLARNLVYDGQLAWNLGVPAFESYGSPLWVATCAIAERVGPFLHLSTSVLVQSAGIACVLGAIVVASRFRSDRSASLIAPLFLAASGAAAAAAGSGLEAPAVMFLAIAAFRAHERGRSGWFAFFAALLCLAQAEALALVLAMLALRFFGKPNDDEGEPRRVSYTAFLAPFALTALMALVRWRISGFVLPPSVAALVKPDPSQLLDGMSSLYDFFLASVSPLLLVFPAVYLVRGSLSRTGAHAVFLALVWMAVVAGEGRSPLPFSIALAPALPFVFLGVQEGMIATLDGTSPLRRRLTLCVFALALAGSILASRTPSDLGPIPLAKVYSRWLGAPREGVLDPERSLARAGLLEEIATTGRLRKAGIFLRDQAEAGATVLTPWPGAVGYLSRQTVYDVLGRTDPLHALERPRAWTRRERGDVVSALSRETDYVVPFCRAFDRAPSLQTVARAWSEELDVGRGARTAEIAEALGAYELVSVPVEDYTKSGTPHDRETFFLLRSRKLAGGPRIDLRCDGGRYHVVALHSGAPQIVDLVVTLVDDQGTRATLRPTGELDPRGAARARAGVLLYDSGTRGIELVRGAIPTAAVDRRWVEIRAVLTNPGREPDDAFGAVGTAVSAPVP